MPSSRNGISAADSSRKAVDARIQRRTRRSCPHRREQRAARHLEGRVRRSRRRRRQRATAAAFSTSVPPLGHAVAIQNAPSTSITIIARRPETPAATGSSSARSARSSARARAWHGKRRIGRPRRRAGRRRSGTAARPRYRSRAAEGGRLRGFEFGARRADALRQRRLERVELRGGVGGVGGVQHRFARTRSASGATSRKYGSSAATVALGRSRAAGSSTDAARESASMRS